MVFTLRAMPGAWRNADQVRDLLGLGLWIFFSIYTCCFFFFPLFGHTIDSGDWPWRDPVPSSSPYWHYSWRSRGRYGKIGTCNLPFNRVNIFSWTTWKLLLTIYLTPALFFLCLVAWFLWPPSALVKCLFIFPDSVFPTSKTKNTFSAQPLPTHHHTSAFVLVCVNMCCL